MDSSTSNGEQRLSMIATLMSHWRTSTDRVRGMVSVATANKCEKRFALVVLCVFFLVASAGDFEKANKCV